MRLLGYEFKKMITKRTNQIVLLLMAILVAYTCNNTIKQVEWIEETGESITGHKTTSRERTVDRNAGSISIGEIFDSPKRDL